MGREFDKKLDNQHEQNMNRGEISMAKFKPTNNQTW